MALVTTQTTKTQSSNTPITQPDHAFTVGTVVYYNGTDYLVANASSPTTIGEYIVSTVIDPNTFTIARALEVISIPSGVSTLLDSLSPAVAPGDWLYTSFTTSGLYTLTEGSPYSNPIAQVIDATTLRYMPYRAEEKPVGLITASSREQYTTTISAGTSHTFTHNPESATNARMVQLLRLTTIGDNIAPAMTPYDPDGYSSREAFINDQDLTTFWYNNLSSGPVGDWIGLDNSTPVTVSSFTMYDYQGSNIYTAPDFVFEGSNDGTNWTMILNITGAAYSPTGNTYTFTPATYQYFRWRCITAQNTSWWVLGEIKLFEHLAAPYWTISTEDIITFDSPTQTTVTNTGATADFLLNIIL